MSIEGESDFFATAELQARSYSWKNWSISKVFYYSLLTLDLFYAPAKLIAIRVEKRNYVPIDLIDKLSNLRVGVITSYQLN